MGKLEDEEFVCIDCETTGLDPKQDRVIEVAVGLFTFDRDLGSFETLVDPECPIPESSIKIHKITQDMVAGKPKIAEVLPQIFKMVGRRIIIGHNIRFDIDVLHQEAMRYKINCLIQNNRTIDTLRLARLYGDSPSNALAKLGLHFNVEAEEAHRAMSDVNVNIAVFKHLSCRYKTTERLFKELSRPILLKAMPLGKHKGRPFKEIPLDYLKWAARMDFDQDLLFSIRSEINKRKKGNAFEQAANPFADL